MYPLQQIFSGYGKAGRQYKTAGQPSGRVDRSDPRALFELNKKLEILFTDVLLDVLRENVEPLSHILRKCFQSAEVYVPGLLVILLHHRECREEGWGWIQQRRYVKNEARENSVFYFSRVLDFSPEHTHLHPIRCIDTYEGFP